MYEEYLSKSLSNTIMARQALDMFRKTNQKDLKNGASYHVQQAIELLLKYNIYNNNVYNKNAKNNSNIKQIFTHDLELLITKYCIPLGLYVPKKIIKNAVMYTNWEAESRYSLNYSVRIDSILSALDETEAWLISIKPSYKAKIIDVKRRLNMI